MIEVHPNPQKALSDRSQSLSLPQYEELMKEMAIIGQAVCRWPQEYPLSKTLLGSHRQLTINSSASF